MFGTECSQGSWSPEPQTALGSRGTDQSLVAWTDNKNSQSSNSSQAKNSHESWLETKQPTSKSQITVYSVPGDCLNSLIQSGSKFCRGGQLTLTMSSLESTWWPWTTRPWRSLETSSSILDTPNQPKLSKLTGNGSLHLVHSSMWCSSSPIKKLNLFATVSISLCLLVHQHCHTHTHLRVLNLDKANCKWSEAINNVLMNSQRSDSLNTGIGQWWGETSQKYVSWKSMEACQLDNQGKCAWQASKCKYRHVCTWCRGDGHIERDCVIKNK